MGLVVRDSAWLDLCWHGLALLPLPPGDAASLYDERYIAWTNKHLRPEPRTLPADAPTLAAWLATAPRGHFLHALPQLHTSVDEFAEQASLPFAQVKYTDPQHQQLAVALQRHLPLELIEVFRAGLWGELRAGYLELRDQYGQQPHELEEDLMMLAGQFPAVAQVDWLASHPLRHHGRLLRGQGRPQIAVGMASDELQVPRFAPLLQGWHELVLLHVLNRRDASGADPRAGQPGHTAHQQVERLALTLGARLLQVPELGSAQQDWLAWVLRRVPAAQGTAAVAWVGSGALLPGSDASELADLQADVAAALRSAT